MSQPETKRPGRTSGTRPNLGYAFLRLFTDIRPGEAAKALLLALNIFLLLLAYYLIKPVREALLLVDKDAPRIKSYLSGAQAILFVFIILGFSWLASKVSRHKLIAWVTLFFISNLVVFYILHLAGVGAGAMGIIFFIWIGIFNYLVVAQFWGFANDLYTHDAGKRIFPLIAFGATLGAVAGSRVAKLIIGPFGLYNMMLLSGGLLVLCIVLAMVIHRRDVSLAVREKPEEPKAQEKPLKPGDGISLVVKTRYLLFIALAILVYNFINTIGEYIISDVAARAGLAAVARGEVANMGVFIGKFFSDYQFLTNILALVIQLFLVSRIFRWLGVGGALFVLPFIALGGYAFISMGATLLLVKWVKSLENGTDYSLMNTTKAALFLVTSREEKYKAKVAIDTFFVRGGDALAALAVFAGTTFLGLSIERFAVLNIAFVFLWIAMSVLIYKHYMLRRGRPEAAAEAGLMKN